MDAPVIFAGFDVGIDDVFDKVRRRSFAFLEALLSGDFIWVIP
jgi:hypothetical protein